MSRRRVVITGMGWVTCLGSSVEKTWQDLLAGKSGINFVQGFDVSEHVSKIAGEILGWDGGPNIEKREVKRIDRFVQYALNAAIDAVNDAGIDFAQENSWRCGTIVGSGVGGMETYVEGVNKMEQKGPRRVSPFLIPKLLCNAAAGNVSIHFHLQGPNSAVASACASGAHAIGQSADAIRHDTADVMVAGGAEGALTALGLASFSALRALSCRNDDPERASRPFDKDRDGFVMADGAGILVLEELEHAKARGAKIYAEVLGFGQSADGSHITAPDEHGRGAAFAMNAALKDAAVKPEDIDYINAHGTSTPQGDLAETRAVKLSFGDHAYKMPVSSTKSMLGHSMGASGGIETIIVAKTIQTGMIAPTTNLDEPGEECDLDYVPNTARQGDVKIAMTNSFGFGGHNVSLVIGKV